MTSSVRVIDADGADVPADGTSQGEIAIRGNNVMLGYYKGPRGHRGVGTRADGTWFNLGSSAVLRPRRARDGPTQPRSTH